MHCFKLIKAWCSIWRACAFLCWSFLVTMSFTTLKTKHEPRLIQSTLTLTTATTTISTQASSNESQTFYDKNFLVDAERRLPLLPFHYWYKHRNDKNKFYKNKYCAPFPSIYDLHFHNTYWQTLHSTEGVFHLFSAYLDNRKSSVIGPAVRILAVHDRIKPNITTYCQLWFEERKPPVLVRSYEYKYMWYDKWGNYWDKVLQPYLVTCVLPSYVRHQVPVAVSLVKHACDRASNNLRVQYSRPNPPEKRCEFAVCVKGLDFLHDDVSVRLIEWIELLRLLGADKIFFYQLQVHPNITKVLDYYNSLGVTTVTPITLPGGQPNLPALQHMYLKKKRTHKRQMELIPYNDCLFRHMYEYRWLVLLDIDEVIVPMEDPDWSSLMKRVLPLSVPAADKPPRSSYHATNIYFLDSQQHAHGWEPDIPRHLHMLQHVYRSRNFTTRWKYVKAFHETDRVLTLHNHFPRNCVSGKCKSYPLQTQHARLHHYRADCMLPNKCQDLVEDPKRDTTLWRWRKPLIEATDKVMRALRFS